jgi:phage tail-like protein
MAPPATRRDPFPAFHFRVEIDGIQPTEFMECSGLSSETDVIEYREGGDPFVRKLPGLTRYGRIVLRRGLTDNRELWDWRQTVVTGQIQRRSGVIVLMDDARKEVLRWRFVEGWPVKYEGPVLNARSSEVAIESIEIEHEGLELD